MATIYDRNTVTVVVSKGMLALKKTTEEDRKLCPDMIFSHNEAESHWRTLLGAKDYSVKGDSLGLYSDKLNARGNYLVELQAAVASKQTSQRTGEDYMRNDEWSHAQLVAFKPVLLQLEVVFYGGPKLCAYVTPPPARVRGGSKARVVPAITRIDVESPEGKAIAERHAAPATARIRRG